MNHALYVGRIVHQRLLPRKHGFSYPFFMYHVNLDHLDELPELRPWFSVDRFALARLRSLDYLGATAKPLADQARKTMTDLTGRPVTGEVTALLNLRTLGLYFSPVNFYFGHDTSGRCSHLLAEVSNIPWNERHHYAFVLADGAGSPRHPKKFKVSPFNPVEQQYRWHIVPPGETARIEIEVDDQRGRVFNARLELTRRPLDRATLRSQMIRRPAMTAAMVGAIYWQALRLYLKRVPYIPYRKETI